MRLIFPILLVALLGGCADKADTTSTPTSAITPATAATAPKADSTDLSALSLKEIFDRSQQLSARERQLSSDQRQDIEDTMARLGSAAHGPAGEAEAKRLRETWPPQIMQVDAELERLHQEIRRRCPNGASLNAERQDCRQ